MTSLDTPYKRRRWRQVAFTPDMKWATIKNETFSPPPAKLAMRSRYATSTKLRLRRRGRRRRGRRIPYRSLSSIPPTIIRRLSTCISFNLDPGAASVSTHQLYLNSAYDPLGTASATQQPLGFDQYEALYNRYCVLGYKVTIEVVSSDNTNPVVYGFCPMTSSSALTNYTHYKELPGCTARIMTPDQDKIVIFAKGSIKKWLLPAGGKLLSDDQLHALVGTNPNKILYGHIFMQAADSTTDVGGARAVVKMEQVIKFFDRKTPARSTQ